MKTTATYPNRLRDKQMVEKEYGLTEEGNDDTIFYTLGYEPLAEGYERIVYGDHGPYVEFKQERINWKICRPERRGMGYYDTYLARGNKVTKLYIQRFPVKDLPNPPKGKYAHNNNCPEGYADYKTGMVYVSTDDIRLEPKCITIGDMYKKKEPESIMLEQEVYKIVGFNIEDYDQSINITLQSGAGWIKTMTAGELRNDYYFWKGWDEREQEKKQGELF